jgi:hypothetical protein
MLDSRPSPRPAHSPVRSLLNRVAREPLPGLLGSMSPGVQRVQGCAETEQRFELVCVPGRGTLLLPMRCPWILLHECPLAPARRCVVRPAPAREDAGRTATEGPGISRHRGEKSRDAGSVRFCAQGRAALHQRTGGRADGHRQGAGGAGHSPPQSGERAAAGGVQLLGDGRYVAGKSALWARARVVYWSDGFAAGLVRVCRRWNGVSRRGGRDLAVHAGESCESSRIARSSAWVRRKSNRFTCG